MGRIGGELSIIVGDGEIDKDVTCVRTAEGFDWPVGFADVRTWDEAPNGNGALAAVMITRSCSVDRLGI